jgi:hypothetical protein
MALRLRHLSHAFHELERRAKALEPILLLQVMLVHEPPIISKLATQGAELLTMEGRDTPATGDAVLAGQTYFVHGYLLGLHHYTSSEPGMTP